jgi:SEFIR domain-containing protein
MIETSCRVFISYAHDSEPHKQLILEYANWLNDPGGLDCWIDRFMEDSDMPEGWPHWMRGQIREAKYVLVVCSPKFLARYNGAPEEHGKGLGAKFESTLMVNDIYQNGSLNVKFIPVVTSKNDLAYIPDILQVQTHYDLSDSQQKESLYRRLTNQPKNKKPKVSAGIIVLATNENKESNFERIVETPTLFETQIVENPELKVILDMKPGTKILQAFFGLPVIKRFRIAKEIGLVQEGESLDSTKNLDKLSALFLERAYKKDLLSVLWSKLFDESIDPNPFKK